MSRISLPLHGRGASDNPPNRFSPIYRDRQEHDWLDPEDPAPRTRFFRDHTKTLLTANHSPDIPYAFGLNPYRGCEHGCAYCYARPYHEYLGLSAGLDFETQIFVKTDAPELLRRELRAKQWRPQMIGMSGVTDAWQPIERRLEISRGCLEVLAEFRNPVGIVTKNALIARDVEPLAGLARFHAVHVFLSITTLDAELARILEPRASAPAARLRTIRELTAAGIPCAVLFAPVIPGLNDTEMSAVLEAARDAGAIFASYSILRLPHAVGEIFSTWLEQHFPSRKEKILSRVRELHGGQLADARFGRRRVGTGWWAESFRSVFCLKRQKLGYAEHLPPLSVESFRTRSYEQRSLFD